VTLSFRREVDEDSFFWDVNAGSISKSLIIHYRLFRTTYRSHLQGSKELSIHAA